MKQIFEIKNVTTTQVEAFGTEGEEIVCPIENFSQENRKILISGNFLKLEYGKLYVRKKESAQWHFVRDTSWPRGFVKA